MYFTGSSAGAYGVAPPLGQNDTPRISLPAGLRIKQAVGKTITFRTFAIGWKGRYRIEGPAFVYADNDSGRVTRILGYPTDQLA